MDANQLLIIDIQGSAGIVLEDGSIKALSQGDMITVGDIIITAADSSLMIDAKGVSVSIPANQRIKITPDLVAETARDSSETTIFDDSIDDAIAGLNQPDQNTTTGTSPLNNDVSDFLSALEGDGDLLDSLEATAAGGNAAAGSGGTSFVTLARIAEGVDPSGLSFDDSFAATNSDDIFTIRDTTDGVVPEAGLAGGLVLNEIGLTNNSQPAISGISINLVGQTVLITITDPLNNVQTVEVIVQPDGTFTLPPLEPFPDGPILIEVEAIDLDGNPVADTITVNIDTTAPVLSINTVADSASPIVIITGSVTGLVAGDDVTITVTDSAGQVQTLITQVNEQGNWSITTAALAEGPYNVEASAVDEAGNLGNAQANAVVDLTAPLLTIDTLVPTSDPTPVITGSSNEVGGTVSITIIGADGTEQTLSAIVNQDGSWQTTVLIPLPEGNYQVSASIIDSAGNITIDSESGVINSEVSTLTVSIDELGQVNDITPAITGQTNAPIGAVVTITVVDSQGITQLITTTVTADGSFSADVPTGMNQGEFEVTVLVSTSGQTASADASGIIDSIAPVLEINGPLNSNDNTPLISGGSDLGANQTVTIVIVDADNITQTLTAQTDAQGNWQITAATLADGEYVVTATALDAADNQGQTTATGTIKTSGPVINLDPLGLGNDATPSISGSTDLQAGESVNIIITDSNSDLYQIAVVVDENGEFSIESPFLPEGNYSVEVSGGDDFGNTTTVQGSGVIDTLAPTISINSIGAIDDLTPTISGTTSEPAGKVVQLEITDSANNTQILSALVSEGGQWSIDVVTELAPGVFDVVALITDDAGNSSQVSEQGNLVTDGALININDIGTLNDSTPTISGTSSAAPGVTVSIFVTDALSATQSFSATVLADGTWSANVPLAMAEGSFTVRAEVTETGFTNFDTAQGLLDLTFPNFSINEIGETNDSTPTISGVSDLEAGDVVNITLTYGNAQELSFSATVLTDGSWRIATPQELPEGEFTVVATVEDGAGNSVSDSVTGILDLTSPIITIDPLSPSNDPSPLVSGTANEPSGTEITIEFTDSNGVIHTVQTTVNTNGEWQVSAGQDLSEGIYTVTASIVDVAGNQTIASADSFTDYTGPELEIQPLLTLLGQAIAVNGTSDLPVGSEVAVYQQLLNGDVNLVGTAITDSDGNWSLIGLGLSLLNLAGVYVEATDEFGNAASDTLNWNDNTPPVLTISVAELTSDNTPTVTGNTDIAPGKQVEVMFTDNNGVNYTLQVTVQADGSFSATAPTLVDGDFNVTVQAIDSSNLVTEVSAGGVIDTQAPLLEINEIGTTGDSTPVISGSSSEPEGSVVNVKVTDSGGQENTYVATVVDGGTWQIEVTEPLPNGNFDIVVSATDGAGNTGTATVSGTVNSALDTITIDAIPTLNDVTPSISGETTLAQGTLISITITQNGNTQVTSATVDASGNWLVDESSLSDLVHGNFTVQASANDLVGNSINTIISASIDLVAPIITITPIATDNEALPTIAGTSDLVAGSNITVTFTDINNNSHTVITQVDASGNWQAQATTTLPEGEFTVLASASDSANNIGTDTTTGVTDYTGPALAINPLISVLGIVIGVSGTSDLPAGSEVEVTQEVLGGTVNLLGTAITDANGDWSLVGLSIGLLNLTGVNATATDEYGNESTARLDWNDNTLPVVNIAGDVLTSDDTPTISGTTDIPVGSDVSIIFTDNNGVTYTQIVQVQSGGVFTATAPTLVDGNYSVTATVEEDSGLVNTASFNGTIDTTGPSLTVNAFGIVADSTPVINGTSSEPAGSEVNVSVTDNNGSNYSYLAIVDADGLWQVEVTDPLVNGEFEVVISAEDILGNLSTINATGTIDATLAQLTINAIEVTNDTTPAIGGSATLAQGTIINLQITQGALTQNVTAIVDTNGDWVVNEADLSELSEGAYTVAANAIDDVGNSITASINAEIDLTPPTINITTDFIDGTFNVDTTPLLQGTSSEANTQITIVVDELLSSNSYSYTVISDADGNWSIESSLLALDTAYSVDVSVSDAAGNSSTDSGLLNYLTPFRVTDSDPGTLGLLAPSIEGTAPAGAQVYIIGSGLLGIGLGLDLTVLDTSNFVTANADGDWFGYGPLISVGAPLYAAYITDDYYIIKDINNVIVEYGEIGQAASSSSAENEAIFGVELGLDSDDTVQNISLSDGDNIDLSRVMLSETIGEQQLTSTDLTISDVLSDTESNDILTLSFESEEKSSLAFDGASKDNAESAVDMQNQSNELIKKLIESGNNQIDS